MRIEDSIKDKVKIKLLLPQFNIQLELQFNKYT